MGLLIASVRALSNLHQTSVLSMKSLSIGRISKADDTASICNIAWEHALPLFLT